MGVEATPGGSRKNDSKIRPKLFKKMTVKGADW